MYDAPWKGSVTVDLPKPHGRETVRTTREAADCLIDKWPDRDFSAERDDALRLCLAVYEEGETPEMAKSAFLSALLAAGLFFQEDGIS
ncbi:DUF982 domain-containing protein [Aliirhizobium terrae]|uniref:DUF982 domain-containing protein n=1 Tax=Terrirhizobium terrae TaxID=2926709 RepID=UPI00257898E0|nr:DUF982 domain-containing protein [Rhizobium sp. CC-CFT758]WJH41599.1 DUF982 domain-containing protein [Rhizobium sp. CC-CFT758]